MIYLIILAAIVITYNVRNNLKLKAEIAKLKAEAQAGVKTGVAAVEGEVKKIL